MSKYFNIPPGVYNVPKLGRIDTINNNLSNEKAFAVYRLPRRVFPWVKLNKDSASYLKKQKLTAEEVAQLINNAVSIEEVEILGDLSDTQTVSRIKETKLKALKNTKK